MINYKRISLSKDKILFKVESYTNNKRKIINDPVYGFINLPSNLIFDIIEHPYFQRLRRIKQLGLTHLVYPGALHTRFHHSLGAMHLMQEALQVLQNKGIKISNEEAEGALIGILLHDIGHGPFSHALEHSFVINTHHEELSGVFMQNLNDYFDGALSIGIDIFYKRHEKKYLSQLISGQLDVDRLDYLTRDSFFTGVSEGVIGTKRLVKMMNVSNNELVADAKGIYSVEKFIVSRRLMYWQVYLHKTVIAAEQMLIKILKRAKYLSKNGTNLFTTPALRFFLENDININDFESNSEILELLFQLDDFDIFTAIKVWTGHQDRILSTLCKGMTNRKLFRCEIQPEIFDYFYIEKIREETRKAYRLKENEHEYFVHSDTTSNFPYNKDFEKINLLFRNGKVKDIAEITDNLNISVISKKTIRHILCYPKDIGIS
ncbi:MAG: HD domain-containing protein [Bacteroidales bacterium]|nr:HD domain-containing protein [Bacteroidales bacterium]